ncbi:MAG: PTS sugar transporter subunit IIA [Candidatus Omnitrophota bacterium]|nr:PTS sugar transporter subunit IIA [Candidatus Omnitrophota bacterium]
MITTISELLEKNAVSTDLKAQEKEEMLSELVDLLIISGTVGKADKDDILKRLLDREVLGSTGIGKGVAIPHAKCPKLKKMVAAFGVSKKGLDFKSLDGEATQIFFLLLAPGDTPGPHLKALAKISRLLDDKFVRERLRLAKSTTDVLRTIREEEQKKIQ